MKCICAKYMYYVEQTSLIDKFILELLFYLLTDSSSSIQERRRFFFRVHSPMNY